MGSSPGAGPRLWPRSVCQEWAAVLGRFGGAGRWSPQLWFCRESNGGGGAAVPFQMTVRVVTWIWSSCSALFSGHRMDSH